MQALLLDIVVALVRAVTQLLEVLLGRLAFFPFMVQIIASVTFIGIVVAFGYAIWQSVRGKYAEMPIISEVAYMQVR
jgi:flagellar biosynthesis protein FliQ